MTGYNAPIKALAKIINLNAIFRGGGIMGVKALDFADWCQVAFAPPGGGLGPEGRNPLPLIHFIAKAMKWIGGGAGFGRPKPSVGAPTLDLGRPSDKKHLTKEGIEKIKKKLKQEWIVGENEIRFDRNKFIKKK